MSQRSDLRSSNEHIALQNLSIYYTWKNIAKQYKDNKFKRIAPSWNDEFELPDGSYSVSDIQDYIKYISKNDETLTTISPSIIKNYKDIINRKNLHDKVIDSDIKRKEEFRKLAAGQGEDYTTGCLSDYGYIKNLYRLIAIDLSRENKGDADPKAMQQEFVGQLKKLDDDNNATDAGLNNFQ